MTAVFEDLSGEPAYCTFLASAQKGATEQRVDGKGKDELEQNLMAALDKLEDDGYVGRVRLKVFAAKGSRRLGQATVKVGEGTTLDDVARSGLTRIVTSTLAHLKAERVLELSAMEKAINILQTITDKLLDTVKYQQTTQAALAAERDRLHARAADAEVARDLAKAEISRTNRVLDQVEKFLPELKSQLGAATHPQLAALQELRDAIDKDPELAARLVEALGDKAMLANTILQALGEKVEETSSSAIDTTATEQPAAP